MEPRAMTKKGAPEKEFSINCELVRTIIDNHFLLHISEVFVAAMKQKQ
jgi:hypothetical protein